MSQTAKALVLEEVYPKETLASNISDKWHTWNLARRSSLERWQELRNYLFATDTMSTSNRALPWKNTTTKPKLTQIRDNLFANYKYALMPRSKWLYWEPGDEVSLEKRDHIEAFMNDVVSRPEFEEFIDKIITDFVDYGNPFAMPDWMDSRRKLISGSTSGGYVGPVAVRIDPQSIVFDPTVSDFRLSPKIIRSFVSYGHLKTIVDEQISVADEYEREVAQKALKRLREVRNAVALAGDNIQYKDEAYQIDGFSSYTDYLRGDSIELLTFYGDLYDIEKDKLYRNYKIVVADRAVVILMEPNPSIFAYPPIFKSGWRKRQDNQWAMGPLENLVGLQYRLDHLENFKSDMVDLTAGPPVMIKGEVADFTWGPFERIYTNDPQGDVKLLTPSFPAMELSAEIESIQRTMEEMAGSPKESMGFRTPGEKTAFEIQRLENAASRIFQNKIMQLERELLEPLLNAMLELAIANAPEAFSVKKTSEDYGATVFLSLTKDDITGAGRIRPLAARHFAERANMVQNLSNLVASGLWQDQGIRVHFSGKQVAKLLEESLDLKDWDVFRENVQVYESAKTQVAQQIAQEEAMTQMQTPSNVTPDDTDPMMDQQLMEEAMQEAEMSAATEETEEDAGADNET